ncbi:hypothetical protein VNO77_07388 [Canavalia gladiata]|uniref:Uncharacterized protein n=1 Tax=Canavalia gladiata TaxID=3824 RepID=A0AAN9MD93_CANGL
MERDDAQLVEEIVKTVNLELKNQVNSKGLIGIDKPIAHLVSLLHQESKDVRVIGIWGMGGKEGTEAIRSIRINLSVISELKLSPYIFTKMNKLHYLDIHGEHYPRRLECLPQGLQSFPTKLRYLRWMNYPLKSLPENFSAEKLVILDLTRSRLRKLWDGVQNLANLKEVILYFSTYLEELPDFSKATNLEVLDMYACEKLTNVHPYIFSLEKLRKIDLTNCCSITELRSDTDFTSPSDLKITLSRCIKLREFSVTSKNITKLALQFTPISALPRCLETFTRLQYLDLEGCNKLQTLPELPSSLKVLYAGDCTSLKTIVFPSKSSEQFKENNKTVEFWNCLKLDEDSLIAVELNAQMNVKKFASQHLYALENNPVENYDDYNDKYCSYQSRYMYPGSSLPDWLVYKTVEDYIIIDLSSAPPSSLLGFILCFIVVGDEKPFFGRRLQFNISVSDGDSEDEEDDVKILTRISSRSIESDHVCVIYDQRCSCYLTRRAKNQSKFKIKATVWFKYEYECPGVDCQRRVALKGFGVMPISISTNHNFIQQMELCDTNYISMPLNKWKRIALSIILSISLLLFIMKFLI